MNTPNKTNIGDLTKSCTVPYSFAVTNLSGSEILGSAMRPNSVILSSEISDEVLDRESFGLFATDSNGNAVRLTYTIKLGNGLVKEYDIEHNRDNVIMLAIDDWTIKTHGSESSYTGNGSLYVATQNICDNYTITANNNNIMSVVTANLDHATDIDFGITHGDDITIDTNDGVLSVITDGLNYADDESYTNGIVRYNAYSSIYDARVITAKNGNLGVNTWNLDHASYTNYGVVKIDVDHILENGTEYTYGTLRLDSSYVLSVATWNLDKADDNTWGVVKTDNKTILSYNGYIHVFTQGLDHATNSEYGIVVPDDYSTEIDKADKLAVKRYGELIGLLDSIEGRLKDIWAVLDNHEGRIAALEAVSNAEMIFVFLTSGALVTSLAEPIETSPGEMPLSDWQELSVTFTIITNCKFGLNFEFDENNISPAITLQKVKYANIETVDASGLTNHHFDSTENVESTLKFTFKAKNYYSESDEMTKSTMITVTASSINDNSIYKQQTHTFIRYNMRRYMTPTTTTLAPTTTTTKIPKTAPPTTTTKKPDQIVYDKTITVKYKIAMENGTQATVKKDILWDKTGSATFGISVQRQVTVKSQPYRIVASDVFEAAGTSSTKTYDWETLDLEELKTNDFFELVYAGYDMDYNGLPTLMSIPEANFDHELIPFSKTNTFNVLRVSSCSPIEGSRAFICAITYDGWYDSSQGQEIREKHAADCVNNPDRFTPQFVIYVNDYKVSTRDGKMGTDNTQIKKLGSIDSASGIGLMMFKYIENYVEYRPTLSLTANVIETNEAPGAIQYSISRSTGARLRNPNSLPVTVTWHYVDSNGDAVNPDETTPVKTNSEIIDIGSDSTGTLPSTVNGGKMMNNYNEIVGMRIDSVTTDAFTYAAGPVVKYNVVGSWPLIPVIRYYSYGNSYVSQVSIKKMDDWEMVIEFTVIAGSTATIPDNYDIEIWDLQNPVFKCTDFVTWYGGGKKGTPTYSSFPCSIKFKGGSYTWYDIVFYDNCELTIVGGKWNKGCTVRMRYYNDEVTRQATNHSHGHYDKTGNKSGKESTWSSEVVDGIYRGEYHQMCTCGWVNSIDKIWYVFGLTGKNITMNFLTGFRKPGAEVTVNMSLSRSPVKNNAKNNKTIDTNLVNVLASQNSAVNMLLGDTSPAAPTTTKTTAASTTVTAPTASTTPADKTITVKVLHVSDGVVAGSEKKGEELVNHTSKTFTLKWTNGRYVHKLTNAEIDSMVVYIATSYVGKYNFASCADTEIVETTQYITLYYRKVKEKEVVSETAIPYNVYLTDPLLNPTQILINRVSNGVYNEPYYTVKTKYEFNIRCSGIYTANISETNRSNHQVDNDAFGIRADIRIIKMSCGDDIFSDTDTITIYEDPSYGLTNYGDVIMNSFAIGPNVTMTYDSTLRSQYYENIKQSLFDKFESLNDSDKIYFYIKLNVNVNNAQYIAKYDDGSTETLRSLSGIGLSTDLSIGYWRLGSELDASYSEMNGVPPQQKELEAEYTKARIMEFPGANIIEKSIHALCYWFTHDMNYTNLKDITDMRKLAVVIES